MLYVPSGPVIFDAMLDPVGDFTSTVAPWMGSVLLQQVTVPLMKVFGVSSAAEAVPIAKKMRSSDTMIASFLIFFTPHILY